MTENAGTPELNKSLFGGRRIVGAFPHTQEDALKGVEDEARDAQGRWTASGAGGAAKPDVAEHVARAEALHARSKKIGTDAFKIVNSGLGWQLRVKPEDVKPGLEEAKKIHAEAKDLEAKMEAAGVKHVTSKASREAEHAETEKRIGKVERLLNSARPGEALNELIGVSGAVGGHLTGLKISADTSSPPAAPAAPAAPPSLPAPGGKDSKGRIIIHNDVAQAGANLAEALHTASNQMEGTSNRVVRLELSKKKGDKKLLPEARKADEEATKKYRAAVAAAGDHEKKHGHSVVDAWEAHHGRGWPNYRVQSYPSAPKYVSQTRANQ